MLWGLLLGCDPYRDLPDPPGGADTQAEAPCGAADPDAGALVVAWSEAVACEAPLSGVQYTDVGVDLGLAGSETADVEHINGGLLSVDDFDGDGDHDLVLGFRDDPPRYCERTEERFVCGDLPGVGVLPPAQQGISLSDVDGDGLRDLVFAGPPTRLLRNLGGSFTDAGEVAREGAIVELVPGDFNGDGLVDFFAPATGDLAGDPEGRSDQVLWGASSTAWSSTLLDAALSGGVGFDAVALDWQGDGDLDVYVVNDQGATYGGNVLWENRDGGFVAANDACDCGITHAGMGADVGDYNGDGLPDLYLAATGTNVLLEGQEDGGFVDVTLARDASPLAERADMAWGSVWLDHDNDGLLDLLVAQGDLWYAASSNPVVQDLPITLLAQQQDADGTRTFVDVSEALGVGAMGSWRAAVAVDHNGDGLLDLLVSDIEAPPKLYLSQGCTAAGWLSLEAPPGSRVEVCAGGARQVAWASTGSGWGGSKPPVVHFGLGAHQEVDRIQVTLPDGTRLELSGPTPARRAGRVVP